MLKIKNIFLLSIIFLFLSCDSSSQKKSNSNSVVSIKVFSSLTCPHCADFHGKIYKSLKKALNMINNYTHQKPSVTVE